MSANAPGPLPRTHSCPSSLHIPGRGAACRSWAEPKETDTSFMVSHSIAPGTRMEAVSSGGCGISRAASSGIGAGLTVAPGRA